MLARGGTLAAASRNDVLHVHAAPGTERPYQHLAADNPYGQQLRVLVVRDAIDDEGRHLAEDPAADLAQRTGGMGEGVRRAARRGGRARGRGSLRTAGWCGSARKEGGEAACGDRLGGDADTTRAVLRLGEDRNRPPLGPVRELHPRPLRLLRGDRAVDRVAGATAARDPRDGRSGHVGQAVSNGCIRVLNRLLRVLHDVPMGTPVLIRP